MDFAAGCLIAAAVVLGVIVGSFLDVVIDRVPRGVSVVEAPIMTCHGCPNRLQWSERVPIVSHVVGRGLHGACGARMPRRRLAVEVVTGGAFGLVAWAGIARVYPSILVPLMLYWTAIAVALAVIDVAHHRLPNAIVLPAYPVTAVMLTVAAIVSGDYGRLLSAVLGALALGGFYTALALVRPGGMGLGDVKLAGALGMLLAWLGWAPLIVGALAGFVFGGVGGIVLMLGGRATRTTALPFGPFMLLGATFGVGWAASLAERYLPPTALM